MLDPEEIVLAGKVLSMLDDLSSVEARDSAAHLKAVIDQLMRLRQVVTGYPSILLEHTVAGDRRDVHSLTDSICRSNPYTVEASMPSRAVVGRAYVLAKLHFFRLLDKIVRHHAQDWQEKARVLLDLERFVRQTVLTVIAEDILTSIAADPQLHLDLRRKAVYVLADLWEHRTARSVKDFFPLLETTWEAKVRVRITYGALTGTTEVMDLLREGCDPAVIDYFTRDQISADERQALMELVFNATYEELETMRRYMKRHRMQVLGPEDVAQIFNVPLSRLHQTIATPKDMFFTFRERQVNAYHRALHDMPGPKKTAEEYLMIYFLEASDVDAPEWVPDCDGPR